MDALSKLADLVRPHAGLWLDKQKQVQKTITKRFLVYTLAAASILGVASTAQAQSFHPVYPPYPGCWWTFSPDYGWVCR
jgi:hypothetical protein